MGTYMLGVGNKVVEVPAGPAHSINQGHTDGTSLVLPSSPPSSLGRPCASLPLQLQPSAPPSSSLFVAHQQQLAHRHHNPLRNHSFLFSRFVHAAFTHPTPARPRRRRTHCVPSHRRARPGCDNFIGHSTQTVNRLAFCGLSVCADR